MEPNIPKNMKREAAFAAANARSRKKRIGSIGARARSSQRTNAVVSRVPSASEVRISPLAQPSALPRTTPQTIPKSPVLASARPGRSRRVRGP
jgi:hypothetical protein